MVVSRWKMVGNTHDVDNGQVAEVDAGGRKSEFAAY